MTRGAMMIGGAAAAAVLLVPLIALARGGGGGAAPSLGDATTLAEGASGNPTVAVDARSGVAYAAWIAGSDVWVARADDPASAVRANDVAGDAAPHEQAPAQAAVGPDGAVYVLWQNNTPVEGRRFPASDLRLARSEDGGRTWHPAVTVNDDAGGTPSSHTFHDLLAAPDGTLWVTWLDSRNRDAARASNPHVGHGDASLPPGEVRIARSGDGGRTWGASEVVDDAPCPCCRTSVALGRDGAVYVAWRKEYAGDVRDVVVARRAPGAASFDAPVRVHADGWVFPACPHAGPSVVVDGDGRVHVGWYTGREGRQGLWYARSDDGGRSFGAPAALATGPDIPPSQVVLSVDGDDVLAAWEARRRIAIARITAGGTLIRGRGAVEGRLPALDGRTLTWHAGESVRVASIESN